MTFGPFAIGPGEPLGNARRVMQKHELHHLPVWADGKLVGVVSDRDMDAMDAKGAVTVAEVMTPEPYAPSPDTPLIDVVRALIDRNIGSAVVVDGGQIVGIFTATDAMRALIDVLSRGGAAARVVAR
jgi:acetoin utilization protein AcuB